MSHKDIEKKRASDRKYRGSEKGKAATQRYLESHKSELAKKREEEARKRREAFWRGMRADYSKIPCLERLWLMHKAGKDIDFDTQNARYIYEWVNKGRFKKKGKEVSVRSINYF